MATGISCPPSGAGPEEAPGACGAFLYLSCFGEWGALIAAVEVQSVVDASFKEPLQQAAAQTFR
jgi:hypothetical protein